MAEFAFLVEIEHLKTEETTDFLSFKALMIKVMKLFMVYLVEHFETDLNHLKQIICIFLGFDNLGLRFDLNGTVKNWWPLDTLKKYATRMKCFIDKARKSVIKFN